MKQHLLKNYCNTYYADDYRHLYNQRFYDSNKILKSNFTIINYIYGKLIDINERYRFIDGININDRRNINIYYRSYEKNAEFILHLIEDLNI